MAKTGDGSFGEFSGSAKQFVVVVPKRGITATEAAAVATSFWGLERARMRSPTDPLTTGGGDVTNMLGPGLRPGCFGPIGENVQANCRTV